MERMNAKERDDALAIIREETGYFATSAAGNARSWLSGVEGMALRLHSLYVGMCSEDLGAKQNALRERLTADLERKVRDEFGRVGLGLYLNSDPRGNPVGILTPKTGRYNTMGGAEAGWRL